MVSRLSAFTASHRDMSILLFRTLGVMASACVTHRECPVRTTCCCASLYFLRIGFCCCPLSAPPDLLGLLFSAVSPTPLTSHLASFLPRRCLTLPRARTCGKLRSSSFVPVHVSRLLLFISAKSQLIPYLCFVTLWRISGPSLAVAAVLASASSRIPSSTPSAFRFLPIILDRSSSASQIYSSAFQPQTAIVLLNYPPTGEAGCWLVDVFCFLNRFCFL
ncbi:hypothetical protein TRVL_03373 [Trypanosoma vivax]|nr:hypothetical protein TRVL_03373 [Trypanosoma vivax]